MFIKLPLGVNVKKKASTIRNFSGALHPAVPVSSTGM